MVHKKIMTTHTRSSFIQNKILADAARLGAILVPGFVDDDGEVPLLAGVTGCNKERLQGAPDALRKVHRGNTVKHSVELGRVGYNSLCRRFGVDEMGTVGCLQKKRRTRRRRRRKKEMREEMKCWWNGLTEMRFPKRSVKNSNVTKSFRVKCMLVAHPLLILLETFEAIVDHTSPRMSCSE